MWGDGMHETRARGRATPQTPRTAAGALHSAWLGAGPQRLSPPVTPRTGPTSARETLQRAWSAVSGLSAVRPANVSQSSAVAGDRPQQQNAGGVAALHRYNAADRPWRTQRELAFEHAPSSGTNTGVAADRIASKRSAYQVRFAMAPTIYPESIGAVT